MRDLPQMLEATRPYVDSGRLQVITINGNLPDGRPEMRRVLRRLNIKGPVIHDGGLYDPQGFHRPIPAVEWGVHSWPSTFLINPQGVIVANHIWAEDLGRVLDFYLTNEPPVIGLDGWVELHGDGKSVSIFAQVTNQGHSDVNLRLSAHLTRLEWDENNVICGYEDLVAAPKEPTATVSFSEFCETTHEFVIETDEDWHTLGYALFVEVPGGEDLLGREDRGYELMFNPMEFRLINLERDGMEWVVQPE
jgi:hypothetical protein